jgi:DNA (cytosine-5)-methyltransferase 1
MLDLFSGIGGFALAAEWVWGNELDIVSFCEKDGYCQKVLKKHWPDVPIVEDVRDVKVATNTTGNGSQVRRMVQKGSTGQLNGDCEISGNIDLITGGFPCQPFSQAGKRNGRSDDRHLWPEMLRVIRTIKPTWVVAENVRGLLSIEDGMVFEQVCVDLEDSGYDVQAFVIPAVACDAKHRRDRVWFVAHANAQHLRCSEQECKHAWAEELGGSCRDGLDAGHDVANASREGLQKRGGAPLGQSQQEPQSQRRSGEQGRIQDEQGTSRCRWLPEPDVGRVADGIPCRVDRLRSLGNAIVPQVAERIFRAIKETERR